MPHVREALSVSDADYEMLLEQSRHRCWICGGEEIPGRRLAVDHDHVTNAVRGLLCTSCNRKLGALRNTEWLRRAVEYLNAADRAFGDSCGICFQTATSKRRVSSDGVRTVYEYTCCGSVWKTSHVTKGIPMAWLLGARPVPQPRPVIDMRDDSDDYLRDRHPLVRTECSRGPARTSYTVGVDYEKCSECGDTHPETSPPF